MNTLNETIIKMNGVLLEQYAKDLNEAHQRFLEAKTRVKALLSSARPLLTSEELQEHKDAYGVKEEIMLDPASVSTTIQDIAGKLRRGPKMSKAEREVLADKLERAITP